MRVSCIGVGIGGGSSFEVIGILHWGFADCLGGIVSGGFDFGVGVVCCAFGVGSCFRLGSLSPLSGVVCQGVGDSCLGSCVGCAMRRLFGGCGGRLGTQIGFRLGAALVVAWPAGVSVLAAWVLLRCMGASGCEFFGAFAIGPLRLALSRWLFAGALWGSFVFWG